MSSARPYRQKPPVEKSRPALDLLDESFHRLRAAPLSVLGVYYTGTLPFVLGLLYFWADLSHTANAERYGTGAALGVALLFLWMKVCQALFAGRLRTLFSHRPVEPWSPGGLVQLFLVQGTLHAVGLFVLVAAAAVTLPFGWAYAFSQSVTAVGAGEKGTVREVLRRSWRAARLWPKQNHLMLLILALFGLFVWINVLTAFFGLPHLLKLATGDDNAFTRGGVEMLNSTFVMVTLCLVYLLMDPVVKTFYALRCFYADSAHSGEDLKSELRALPAPVAKAAPPGPPAAAPLAARSPVAAAAAAALAALLLLAAWPAGAGAAMRTEGQPAAQPAAPANNIQPPALDKTIEEVMHRREFAWRVPPAPSTAPPVKDGFFDGVLRWSKDIVKSIFNQVAKTWKAISDWWADLKKRWTPEKKEEPISSHDSGPGFDAGPLLRVLAYGLIAVIAIFLGYLGWKTWRGKRLPELAGSAAPAGALAAPDLSNEEVLANQLPEDEWLQLARRLLEAGEHRMALRAFYLSILALLGTRGLLVISRHKSNRDYLAELRRRGRDRAEMQSAFTRNVGRYERVWYGPHPASQDLFDQFLADRQIICDATVPATPASVSLPPVPA